MTPDPDEPFEPETEPARAARNETLFRQVNEQVVHLADPTNSDALQLVCECSDMRCTSRISMPPAEYKRTRADPRTFLVLPEHVDPSVERPVFATKDYVIVRKVGVAGRTAETLADEADGAG